MATVSTLTIDLVANSAKLASGFKKGSRSAKTWAKETRGHVNSVATAFSLLTVASAASLGAVYTNASKAADQLGKLSDKLGEAPTKLQALQRAGELTGVSLETTNMALQRMTRRTSEAAQGTGEAVNALRELNIDAKTLATLSPAEQFKLIADSMGDVGSQGDRVRLAMKLFDSEGVALVNTLALGSDGLNKIEQDVKDYGIALTRVDIAKIEAANDAWFEAKEVTKGFSNTLAVELSPVIGALAGKFAESAKEAGGMGVVAKKAADFIVSSVAYAADAVHGLRAVWLGVKAAAFNTFSASLTGIAFLDRGISALLDKLPFVEASANEGLQRTAAAINEKAGAATEAFQSFILEPLPSAGIKSFVDDVFEKAQIAAEEVAAEKGKNVGASLGDVVVPTAAASVAFGDGRVDDKGNTNPFLPQDAEGKKQQALDLFTAFREQHFSASGLFQLAEQAQAQKHEAALTNVINIEEKRRLKAKQNAEKSKLGDTKKFFAKGFSDLAQNSKKAFELQKAFRIADTVQNTYSAAMGAYNALSSIYLVGPALGAAAAAAAISFGAQQISAIKSSRPGGGSVSSSSPAAVSTSSSVGNAPSAQLPSVNSVAAQQQETGTTINFYGNVSSNNTQQFAEDIKRLVDDGDFVLIESTSRNGLELSSNAA